MDEAEQFRNVRAGDAAESLHSYLRKLAEPANSSVGFIIGSYALTLDDAPELLVRQDVRTRVREPNYIEILPLPAVEQVQGFLHQLLAELIDQNRGEARIQAEGLGVTLDTYPFSAASFDLLCEYASQDPIKALPRNFITALNECSIQAWDEEKPVVDEVIVNEVAPLVFS
jgi:hypothetical protein